MSVGRARSAVRALIIAGMLVALLGACAGGGTSVPPPSVAVSPAASASASMTATAGQMGLRRAAGLLWRRVVPYPQAESPTLTTAPRLVLKADLLGDDRQGFVVIYDFPDAGRAYAAGAEMADYIASGPGRVQFPNNARFVMRQVGSTLVFYTWTDSDAPEPDAGTVAATLAGLGVEIPIAR